MQNELWWTRTCWILPVALAALHLPLLAAKRITVEQVRQTLVQAQSLNQPDDLVVQQIADAELTARLSGPALQQFDALSPGLKTTRALHALADSSAFLDPPPNETPALPAPDLAPQKAIVARTINYVTRILPTLPNFLATRVTEHYVDSLHGSEQAESVLPGRLFSSAPTALPSPSATARRPTTLRSPRPARRTAASRRTT